MIYHPEGVIRPTPPNAENDTEFVYDYFIKDYLGNVRVVLTEEDAPYTEKFLSTLEEVHREIEERNFDNVGETAEDLPTGYPATARKSVWMDGSVELNEKVAILSAGNGTEIGPSIVMPVRRGDKVALRTDYFYTEDAPGTTYDNVTMLVNEVLLALVASGSGVLNLTEGQLIDMAAGGNDYSDAIGSFFASSLDTTDMSRPHGYLVWMLYDNDMKLIPAGSGAKRVTDPNDLEQLIIDEIPITEDGYLHAYVSNGSTPFINFDNFLLTYIRGKVRQINHYYPYDEGVRMDGLSIDGLDHSDEYLNKYTSKELQTGEFDPALSSGLEMFDFHARFYDPQLGRWFTPDPAEQFSNPYLAMRNNPVMYVDPDGEFVFVLPLLQAAAIGAGIGAASYTAQTAFAEGGLQQNWNIGGFGKAAAFGAISGAASYGIGQLNLGDLNSTAAHGVTQGLISEFSGGDFESGFGAAVFGSVTSSSLISGGGNFGNSKIGNIALSGLAGGIGSYASGGNFWSGVGVGATVSSLNHLMHKSSSVDPKRLREVILADGKLSWNEANMWYRFGQGKPLTVDGSKVDLNFINPNDWSLNESSSIQTLYKSSDGMVYGQLSLTYRGNNQFSIAPDEYDFRMHSGPGTGARNMFTRLGKFFAGNGIPYWINFNNLNTVNYHPHNLSGPNGFKL